jgi:heme exporter protein C
MHRFANPQRFLSIARPLTPWLLVLGVIVLLAGCYAGLFVAPPDARQGDSARILYIHVPAAWLGMGGWASLAIAALVQLVWRHPLAGIAARATAVPGALFTAICLATGSIWGRPTWGTWWEWDGRMTSMLVLLFLYLAFIAISNLDEEKTAISRSAAVYAVVGAVILPIINRSVVWWNSLHQPASISVGKSAIAGEMLWPLGLTLLGFSLLFTAIVLMRMRALIASAKLEARMRRLAAAA